MAHIRIGGSLQAQSGAGEARTGHHSSVQGAGEEGPVHRLEAMRQSLSGENEGSYDCVQTNEGTICVNTL